MLLSCLKKKLLSYKGECTINILAYNKPYKEMISFNMQLNSALFNWKKLIKFFKKICLNVIGQICAANILNEYFSFS